MDIADLRVDLGCTTARITSGQLNDVLLIRRFLIDNLRLSGCLQFLCNLDLLAARLRPGSLMTSRPAICQSSYGFSIYGGVVAAGK